jgi:hypothetical protein
MKKFNVLIAKNFFVQNAKNNILKNINSTKLLILKILKKKKKKKHQIQNYHSHQKLKKKKKNQMQSRPSWKNIKKLFRIKIKI